MAHKKGQGSVRNGRDSHSQRLGVKIFGGGSVTAGISSVVATEIGSGKAAGAGSGGATGSTGSGGGAAATASRIVRLPILIRSLS